MSSGPRVSLLLPNMNNEPLLDEFFEKLARHTSYGNVEIVVVDDGSTDGSRAILRRWRDEGPWRRFTLIEQENAGVIAAFNRCLESSDGEIVVRLDGDATIETPHWLERMLAFHALSDRVGMVVAKIVFETGYIHSFGRSVIDPEGLRDRGTRILEPVGRRTLDSAVERPLERRATGGDEIAEVDAALGCCTLFSRAIAERIGGLDPVYTPVWVEDDDFSLAVRREGKKVFYFPDVRVVHNTTRRNQRHGGVGRRPSKLRANVGRVVPLRLKRGLSARSVISREAPWRVELLHRHYESWREKWGFDPLNPDMDALRARYGDTEVCWRYDDEMRAAGEEIVAAWERARSEAPASEPAAAGRGG
jgi:GT2 family glycosyltransferase